jgi:hypothetical protein
VQGDANSYTAEYWQYDPRTGRRWNVDPLTGMQPYQSPYCAFNNNPVYYNDPLGLKGDKPKEAKQAKSRAKEGQSRDGSDGNNSIGQNNTPDDVPLIQRDLPEVVIDAKLDQQPKTNVKSQSNFIDRIFDWFKDAKFTAEMSGSVDAGLVIDRDFNIMGIKGSIDLSILEANLGQVGFKYMQDAENPWSWDYDYIGKDGVDVSHSVGASIELPWKLGKDTGNGRKPSNFTIGGYGTAFYTIKGYDGLLGDWYSTGAGSDWGVYVGVPLLKKKDADDVAGDTRRITQSAMDKIENESQGGAGGKFYGINFGAGAGEFLSGNLNLKIGFTKPEKK